jgi:hypothetical protein
MSIPLPDYFKPHTASVKVFTAGGGMGDDWGSPRALEGFTDDEQKIVTGPDSTEVISKSQHHVDFDEAVPIGSLVTIWVGLTGEREAKVVAIGRHQHPTLPSYQTLYLE